jgi:2-dehydro-3-deoxy-L-rhamnonate dehydrogenase (NAD+)
VPNATTWEYPAEAWNQVLQVNLTGTFLCCRAAAPHMLKNGYGRIVNVAPVAGKDSAIKRPPGCIEIRPA